MQPYIIFFIEKSSILQVNKKGEGNIKCGAIYIKMTVNQGHNTKVLKWMCLDLSLTPIVCNVQLIPNSN